jgi:catechol 2,3-dioxygenase-like lactoylglutathione lyase family enzyme
MLSKITHITLYVHNQEEALSFYKKLGFLVHTDAQFDEMRWLTLHLPNQKDVELALIKAESPAEKALVGKQAAEKPFLSFETTDCEGDYKKLMALGVSFIGKPEQQPWGISVELKDLYGNRLYICQSA